jgi:hypothetical protein
MTPKEKSKELVDKFTFRKVYGDIVRFDRTLKCALICVDEVIEELKVISQSQVYWVEVKEEINKL